MGLASISSKILMLLSFIVLILDRILKHYSSTLSDGAFFLFYKIPFGYFINPSLFFFPKWSWISWIALVVLITISFFFIHNYKKTTVLLKVAFISIILGGASNVFDRFVYGGVIDTFKIGNSTIINLADILILIGIILLLISLRKKN